MRALIRQKFTAVQRVLEFFDRRPDAIPNSNVLDAGITRLAALSARYDRLETANLRVLDAAGAAAAERMRIERDLRHRLTHLLRLARLVSRHEGIIALDLGQGVGGRGRAPLLQAVTDAISRVAGHRALLLRYGMAPELLADLAHAVEACQALDVLRKRSAAESLALNPAFERVAEDAHDAIRHLDAIVSAQLASEPARLDEWQVARMGRRVETRSAAGDGAVRASR